LNDAAGNRDTNGDLHTPRLTQRERNILQALGDSEMSGRALSRRAGYRFNSAFRRELSQMKKRGLLIPGRMGQGYRRGFMDVGSQSASDFSDY